ncbi:MULTISPECIES: D-ribose pyranase [unclassified Gilliamella]|uniref:D-ribose pyranase n=1 Tax=unclassified Gilliamella TaxID=2685620 RepID=UPI001329D0E1|nr:MULTISPECIES: D-ribose pyranase [unclassified Gilliamella]MWN31319.1 D-ribose pyranase [Gilliamella sp. Pra-s60]MWP29073.1 D-ribose pyranase [Gilliamella sp. Pra-s54]
MYKGQLFNSEIIRVLSQMGHTDQIAIGDAGLPIDKDTPRIDLALTYGLPSFIQVFQTVSQDMQIEKIILAEEIIERNPDVHRQILEQIKNIEVIQNNRVEIVYISHEKLKLRTHQCKAVIRTGECTPFANIILQSGVIF